MLRAALFDLDDTLYPQRSWLAGAWRAVADRASESGVDGEAFLPALESIAGEGSDRGRIIDRALERIGHHDGAGGPELVATLVAAFRGHAPDRLALYVGVDRALRRLARRVPIGLVTDGDPAIQRAKLRALGLAGRFDVVVFSDDLGREHRKPDPLPFEVALRGLGVEPADAVYVGDRPDKDVAGAIATGLRAIRVRTGEYAARVDHPAPWASTPDAVAACELLLLRAVDRATTHEREVVGMQLETVVPS